MASTGVAARAEISPRATELGRYVDRLPGGNYIIELYIPPSPSNRVFWRATVSRVDRMQAWQLKGGRDDD